MFVLGDDKFPHMTLYMARFHNDDIPKIIEQTAAVIKESAPFKCEHTGYFMTPGRYYEASYKKSAQLMKLHEALIAQNSPFRINPGNPCVEDYFAPYSTQQKKNAEETGYDLAHELYRPHVTLTRYKQPVASPVHASDTVSFIASKIAVYKADDNGAVYELLHEFHI